MAHKIQIKRGNKADLPTLDVGEFGLCQDTNELFIGNSGNQKIFPPTASDIGLGDVENYGIATQAEAEAGTSNTRYTTPLRVKQAINIHNTDAAAHDDIRQLINDLGAYAVASGTNTYAVTIAGYTLEEGKTVKIKFTNANTSASTLNINSLGAKAIKKSNGNDLSSGNIKAGQICNLVYTGSVFQLLGEGGEYGTATTTYA